MFGKKTKSMQTAKDVAAERVERETEKLTSEIISTITSGIIGEVRDWWGQHCQSEELDRRVRELKAQLADLQSKKKIEEQETLHLVKIKTEAVEVEAQKKELAMQKAYQEKEMALRQEFFDKSLRQLEEARKEMREMYNEVLSRLPNVNMSIRQRSEG